MAAMAAMAEVNVGVTEVMIANLLGASRMTLPHFVIPMARNQVHSPIIATVTSKTAHRVPAVVSMVLTREQM
jgi:hypothetical protein